MGGSRIIHANVHSDYSRQSLDAWGVRVPLILYAQANGIERIYLYCVEEEKTYFATISWIIEQGTPGKPDKYGDTINVPKHAWVAFPGKLRLAFVKDVPENAVECPVGTFTDIVGLEDIEIPAEDAWAYTPENLQKVKDAEKQAQQLSLL